MFWHLIIYGRHQCLDRLGVCPTATLCSRFDVVATKEPCNPAAQMSPNPFFVASITFANKAPLNQLRKFQVLLPPSLLLPNAPIPSLALPMEPGRTQLDQVFLTRPNKRQHGRSARNTPSHKDLLRSSTGRASNTVSPIPPSAPLTAFRPLRKDGPARVALTRGRAIPLDADERAAAMELVTHEVYAASSRLCNQAKMVTILRFLDCWNLPLIPYTSEVVYALGAALKWRGYRSADLYLYLSRQVARREGATIGPAAQQAFLDVIRSCKRGLGPAKHCEGLVLELLPDLPASVVAWVKGGPCNPRNALIIGSWWMLREIEFSNAELRAVSFNVQRRSVAWTLPASKADPSALGETVTHGCCCTDVAPSPHCPYHLLLGHLALLYRRWPERFGDGGWPLPDFPLFPDMDGGSVRRKV